jgi:hypothetical protein
MAWNEMHQNVARYPEPDLQKAYEIFKEAENSFYQQRRRNMRMADPTVAQESWNAFLKLRKHYGYER